VDLVARFATAVKANGMQVERAARGAVGGKVQEVLKANRADRAFVEQSDAELSPVAKQLRAAGVVVETAASDDVLFDVPASITEVAAAIAETGSLVVESGFSVARGASLIPPVHVAIVRESQIDADLVDYFARVGAGNELPANASIITGASKTADIEGVLVTGVHGPGKVVVVIVNDNSDAESDIDQ
jgi:L-lactate dehydrogenase complex protein LldG